MSLTFASNLTKMIDAGLGGELIAPGTSVAVGYQVKYNEVSGPVASWNDPEGGLPLKSLVVAFEPIQSGTGDPSPENVRPISGRAAVAVEHCGVNLWIPKAYSGVSYNVAAGNTANLVEASADFDGNMISYIITAWGYADFRTPNLKAGQYHIHFDPSANTNVRLTAYRVGADNVIKGTSPSTSAAVLDATFTVEDGDYILIYIGSNTAQTIKVKDWQIERGTTYTGFVSPTVQSVTVQLGNTVYGGRLDVVSGLLTIDHAKITISAFDGVFGASSIGYVVYRALYNFIRNNTAKCNMFKWTNSGYSTMPLYSFGGGSGGNSTFSFVLPSTVTSRVEANEWLAALETPLELVAELITPQTIQLSAQTITSLLGQNNVWSDSGEVAVTWKEKAYTEGY